MSPIPTTSQLSQDAGKPLTLGNAAIRAKQAAPENSPATTITVAGAGGDITKNAQGVAQVQKHQDIAAPAQDIEHSSGGGLSQALGWLGHNVLQPIDNDVLKPVASEVAAVTPSPIKNFVSDASKAANQPLSFVQHEYRYLHDVEARHGMLAAFGEGVGVAAGAVVGGLAAGPEGVVLGGEAAGALEGQILYKTSWARTATGNKYRDPHTGDVVSLGRTLADLVAKPGSGEYSTLSGVVDGISDILLTPLAHAGGIVGDARSAEGAKGALKKVFGGTGLQTPEDVDRAFNQYKSVRNAFTQIAKMKSGDIIANYPKLRGIAPELEQASTPEEVKDVFKEIVTTNKLRTTDTLPTQTFMRFSAQKAREAMADYSGPLSTNFLIGPARWTRRFTNTPGSTFDPETNTLSRQIDPATPDGALDVYRMARYSQNERVAKGIAGAYANALPADRVLIYRNAIMDTIAAQAHFSPVDHVGTIEDWEGITTLEMRRALKLRLDDLTGGANPGVSGEYGRNAAGKELGQFYDPENDRHFNSGILENHTGKLGMPSFSEVKRMGAAARGGHAYLGRADDWFFDHVTAPFFKPLALLTPSYAQRMVLAETALNTWRQGGVNLAKSAYYMTAAKLGHAVDEGDAKAFTGWLYHTMTKLPHNEDRMNDAAALALITTGHMTTPAVSSVDGTSHVLTDRTNATYAFRTAAGKTPRSLKKTKTFGSFRPSDFGYEQAWKDWMREGARSGWTQAAAKGYREALEGGGTVESIPKDVEPSLHKRLPGDTGADTLSTMTPGPLYRESSATDAIDTLFKGSSLGGAVRKYWSNDRDLALGQGESKGVTIEHDAGALHGRIDSSKPSAKFAEERGSAEFQASRRQGLKGVRSVEIKDTTAKPFTDKERFSGFVKPPAREAENEEYNAHQSLIAHLTRAGYKPFEVKGGTRWVRKDLVEKTKTKVSDDDATVAAGKAAAKAIRETPAADRDMFLASKYFSDEHPPAGLDPIDNWGRLVAENFRGMSGKKYNSDVANSIENGHLPTNGQIARIEPGDRPETIKGRTLIPQGSSTIQKITDFGFNRILNPMIDTLSRQPSFGTDFNKEMKLLRPSVDNGVRDYDEATVLAASRASTRTVRFVHNIHTRTQWTETFRNWAPFAFAQEQAYKRAGRLLADDPGAFRRYQLTIHGVGQYMAKVQNATGTTYFTVPGAGILGHGMTGMMDQIGIPLVGVTSSVKGSLSGASVIFPLSEGFRPDTGPLATFAAKSMSALFPETTPGLQKIVGPTDISAPFWKLLVPNSFLQRAIGTGLATHTVGFANSMMQALNNLEFRQRKAMKAWIEGGQKGPRPDIVPAQGSSPKVMQTFITAVRNETRIQYSIRAAVGFATPIDPHVTVQDFGFPDEINALIKKEGSVNKGMAKFLDEHPTATGYLLSKSTTIRKETGIGAEITGLPDGQGAMSWLNKNQDLINKYPQGSTWLMPQIKATAYSSAVYNEQIGSQLRKRLTPSQFVTALYISAGDQVYYARETQFEAALKKAGSTKLTVNHLYQEWTQYKRELSKAYPVWADSFKGGQRTNIARDSINQLQEIRDSGQVPDNPQARDVMTLLTEYNKAEAAYLKAGSQVENYSSAQSKVKQAWYLFLHTTVEKKSPQLAPVAKAVFQYGLGAVTSPLST